MIRKAFKSTVVNRIWATLSMELCPPSLKGLLLTLYFVPGFLAFSLHGAPSDICQKPRGKGSVQIFAPRDRKQIVIVAPASSFQGIRLKLLWFKLFKKLNSKALMLKPAKLKIPYRPKLKFLLDVSFTRPPSPLSFTQTFSSNYFT